MVLPVVGLELIASFMIDAPAGSALCTIGIILSLIGWIFSIIGMHKLSKAFGHGVGFTIGMVLCTSLFELIIGFSKDEYQGDVVE